MFALWKLAVAGKRWVLRGSGDLKTTSKRRTALAAALVLFLSGCYGVRIGMESPASPGMKVVSRPNKYIEGDDLDLAGLRKAAEASLRYFNTSGTRGHYTLGSDTYSGDQIRDSVGNFLRILDESPSGNVESRITQECKSYRPRSGARYTAYYEPELYATRNSDDKFRYPLYRRPDELTLVRLGKFFPNDKRSIHGKVNDGELTPYLTRREIDGDRLLAGRGLELAYVDDPVALYFLHIQGSGRLRLASGEVIRVNFSASNGLPYRSIGRHMLDNKVVTRGSSEDIRSFLRQNPDRRDDLLFYNPRYIFFREVNLDPSDGPIGSLGVPLVAGRSLATDQRYVPPGAVVYIKTEKPVVDETGHLLGWEDVSRFAFSHDTGSAIKGPGRADIYWGEGENAGRAAGYVNRKGDMLVLVCGVDPIRQAHDDSRGNKFSRVAFREFVDPVITVSGSGL